jgi:hypothetical protein
MPVVLIINEESPGVTVYGQEAPAIIIESATQPGPPGVGVPSGGTTGQGLAKASDTDYDFTWVDFALQAAVNAADATLQSNIDAEEAARIAADDLLDGRIDDEITDRTAADVVLGDLIDDEVAARAAADDDLQDNIDAEASARAAADSTLQTNITNEATARDAADDLLQDAIDDEAADRAAADLLLIPLTQKGAAGGVATLDGSTKIPVSQIPAAVISEFKGVVADEAAMIALTAEPGDWVARSDDDTLYILSVAPASTAANWLPMGGPGTVISVNGETGSVSLVAADIPFTPVGSIAATDSQAAVAEVAADAASALTAHVTDATDAHAASAITNTPAGNVAATTVQAAINELDSEKATTGSVSTVATDLSNHISDSSDAHDASAISIVDAGGDFTATDVEGALAELQSDHEADATALTDHISDATGAHAATAIAFAPFGTISSTTVQAAIQEVAAEAGTGGGWPLVADVSADGWAIEDLSRIGFDNTPDLVGSASIPYWAVQGLQMLDPVNDVGLVLGAGDVENMVNPYRLLALNTTGFEAYDEVPSTDSYAQISGSVNAGSQALLSVISSETGWPGYKRIALRADASGPGFGIIEFTGNNYTANLSAEADVVGWRLPLYDEAEAIQGYLGATAAGHVSLDSVNTIGLFSATGVDGTDAPTLWTELADALVAFGVIDSYTMTEPGGGPGGGSTWVEDPDDPGTYVEAPVYYGETDPAIGGSDPYAWIDLSDFVGPDIVDDTVYGPGWDADAVHAPSKNAVYDALVTNGKGWVNHGSTAGTTRPVGFASVEWYGTVEPSNAITGDTWNDPS